MKLTKVFLAGAVLMLASWLLFTGVSQAQEAGAPEKVTVVDLKEDAVDGGDAAINLETADAKIADEVDGARISFDIAPYRIVTLRLDVDMAPLRNRWFNVKY